MLMERHTSFANAAGSGASVSATASTAGASFAASTGVDSAGAAVSGISTEALSDCFCSGTGSVGVVPFSAGVVMTGVTGVADCRSFSRFFSSVRRKALRVVRSALFGLQRSGESGVCAHTEQVPGRDAWPSSAEKSCQIEFRSKEALPWAAQLTGLADRLVATRKAKGIHRQLVADGTSQLEWNFILGQSTGCRGGLAQVTLRTEDAGRPTWRCPRDLLADPPPPWLDRERFGVWDRRRRSWRIGRSFEHHCWLMNLAGQTFRRSTTK
jgi:hypothetical protein